MKSNNSITHADKDGNYFVVKPSHNCLTIYLHLANENKQREIGVVYTVSKVFHIRRNPEKHIFKKNQSYGFNEYVIKTAKKFDKIHLLEEGENGNQYLFPKDFVLEKGSYLHFKNEGFEKQLFVTLKDLEPYKVKPLM
jgi:hypothetical protein